MFEQTLDANDPGVFEVRRRLEAYAELRLSPGLTATTQMRKAVMSAAHRREALIKADATFGAVDATTSARAAHLAVAAVADTHHHAWRRPAAAVFAGCLTLGILAGTAFAAKPGGPLYAARVWTEMATLPGDVVGRAEAEIDRLAARIDEAQQASTAGDGAGTKAALFAYSTIVLEAAYASGGNVEATAALEVSVTKHVAALTQMVESVPAPARDAVERALASSNQALEDLDPDRGSGTGGVASDEPRGGRGHGAPPPGPPGVVGPNPGDARTTRPTPAVTPQVTAAPRPTPTAKPAATPRVAATQRPDATAKPSKGHGPTNTPRPEGTRGGEQDTERPTSDGRTLSGDAG